MDVSVRVSSRGQITIPRAVREALSIREGRRSPLQGRRSARDDRAQPRPYTARRVGKRTGAETGHALR